MFVSLDSRLNRFKMNHLIAETSEEEIRLTYWQIILSFQRSSLPVVAADYLHARTSMTNPQQLVVIDLYTYDSGVQGRAVVASRLLAKILVFRNNQYRLREDMSNDNNTKLKITVEIK